jgi:hypothetical protein
LIQFLDKSVGGQWSCLAAQYRDLHNAMSELNERVAAVKSKKASVVERINSARRQRESAERALGEHWRAFIFEKDPVPADFAERGRLAEEVKRAMDEVQRGRDEWRLLQAEQEAIVRSDEAERGRILRRNVAFEAELTRVRLIHDGVVATSGLTKAGHRPAAWWFPLVCPDGSWFRAMARKAQFRLEVLT